MQEMETLTFGFSGGKVVLPRLDCAPNLHPQTGKLAVRLGRINWLDGFHHPLLFVGDVPFPWTLSPGEDDLLHAPSGFKALQGI